MHTYVVQNPLPEPVQIEHPTSEPISQKSLWEQAAEKLDPEVRQALHEVRSSRIFSHNQNEDIIGTADASSLPELATREAQRRLEDMEHRQWALPIGVAGKTIEIRSLLGKFIAFAKIIKDKGDAFIELDPTGYAKLAWLPFSVFVDLSAKDLEQHQGALDAFSEISFLIYRYAHVESIYHKRNIKEARFEECLVELYKAVLDCEVALLHHFRRHGFLRFLRAIPAVDGWQDRVTSINHLDRRCQSLVDIHVATDILDTRRGVDELVKAERRRDINKILRWIIGHDPSVQRKLVLEKLGKTYSDIGKWLFENEVFTSWVDSTEGSSSQYGLKLLWMHGPVGCGKSSLTTRVIEHFLEQSSVPKHHEQQVSYFYCAKTHGLGSKPIEIFQSMVRQLAWSPKDSQIEQCVKDEWESRQLSETDRLSLDDCKMLSLQLIPRLRKTIIIIDALDECDNPREFLEAMKDLSASFQEKRICVNAFISSRDEVHFAVDTTFSNYLALNITSTATGPDFRRYIERRVDDECKYFRQVTKRENSDILQRLVDELTDRGQLAFRWTELQLALFFPPGRPPNPIDIKRRLDMLKDRSGLLDLNNTSKEIYEHNISDSFTRKDDLHFLLKWALACTRNVHISLITDAIKFHLEQQGETTDHIDRIYILDLTSNLLVINEHDTVQFAHISVKEYFEVNADFASEFAETKSNDQVAETCLQYLLSSYQNFPSSYSVVQLMSRQMEAEFSYYSLTQWALHYSRSGETCSSSGYFKKFIPGALAGTEFAAWVSTSMKWHGYAPEYVGHALSRPPSFCSFFLACVWGFMDIINETISERPELLKSSNIYGENGLHIAAYFNQIDVVKALICTDIDINMLNSDEETALQRAMVDVNNQDRHENSAIHQAIKKEHVDIIRLLLDCRKDLDINLETDLAYSSNFRGPTPLHLAIIRGNLEIVTVLLDKRHDIQINFDACEDPPLHLASQLGHVDIIDTLFRKRADIDIYQKDFVGRTALHVASEVGHVGVVAALLQKYDEFQVNNVDRLGRTALHYAAQNGHVEVVHVLLKRAGPSFDVQDDASYTALHLAAGNGHVPVIETLLRECENYQVNTKEGNGRTPSHLAASKGRVKAVKALLDNGKDVNLNLKDKCNRTALDLAVAGNYVEIVDMLKAANGHAAQEPHNENGCD
ncbi:ankyrin repeat protein [Talaromyces pinophilus]|uniref:Ankyrin repeat protein n=1 Tax=Talaromyces pinophilus TaxID=128442 RepID=A0A6V8H9G5_TALPI|nr:ankyrin repeat protein [Talaromyces pinophilus]